jgi:hypothetical protein
MKVKIKSINNKGSYEQEYVILEVTEACEIGHHLLSDSTYTSDGKLSNKVRHIYWFPGKKVGKGDFVFLYTRGKKAGDQDSWNNKEGTTTHVFYWDLKAAVWNDEGDYAVLFEVSGREQKRVGAS